MNRFDLKKACRAPVALSSLFTGLLLASGSALAYHPFTTDDTGTQGAGGNQLEASYDFADGKDGATKTTERVVPLTYTRGLTDALDVYASIPWQRLSETGAATVDGWGNVAVGAKWRFYENEASKLSFALKPEVVLPVSRSDEAKGLGSAEVSYSLLFIATQETGFGELHFNVEAARADFDDAATRADTRLNTWRVSVAPVWAVSDEFKIGLDFGVQTNTDKAKKPRMGYVGLGMVYSPNEDLDFGLGITRDVSDGAAKTTSATLGVTWRFR